MKDGLRTHFEEGNPKTSSKNDYATNEDADEIKVDRETHTERPITHASLCFVEAKSA